MNFLSQTQAGSPHRPAKEVCQRFGITPRTLDRWLQNERLAFPRPLVINRRRYFNEQALRDWEREQLERQLGRSEADLGARP